MLKAFKSEMPPGKAGFAHCAWKFIAMTLEVTQHNGTIPE